MSALIKLANGQLVTQPVQAILDEFEQAKAEIQQNPKLMKGRIEASCAGCYK
jgi:hypothetical protein